MSTGATLRNGSVSAAVAAGLGLCPEERKSQGLVLDDAVYRNISLASLDRFAQYGISREGAERKAAHEAARSVDVRPDDPNRIIRTLSGGNQQKVVLARWLLRSCKVLLLDEPTRGVDVGARAEIYTLIRELADSGVALVIVSSDIEEVLGLSDRVLVVADGHVVHDGPSDAINPSGVLDRILAEHDSTTRPEGRRRVSDALKHDPSLTVPAPAEAHRAATAAATSASPATSASSIALIVLCVVGVITAGDRFASTDNLVTILRLAAVLGVVSIGMTFVITGGGIDLSVGAILALASVWATTTGTQAMADDIGWIAMVFTAVVVGSACGLVNGALIAYGRVVPFIATLAMLASARGLAELIADRKTQIITNQGFTDFFGAEPLGIPVIVIIFAAGHASAAGSCSTARRSAAVRSRSAATPRQRDWPASRCSATPSTSTRCSARPAASPQ